MMLGMPTGKLAWSILTAAMLVVVPEVALATPSSPTPIAIVNPSFEASGTPSGSNGTQDYWYNGSFTGWTASGNGGWYHPSTVAYPGGGSYNVAATGLPDGSQVAWLQNGSSLKQILTTDLVSNADYTLTFYVGHRDDIALPSSYAAELLAGSTVLATLSNPVDPAAGVFGLGSLTFSSRLVGDPNAGKPLSIVLLASGATNGQVNFDNLSLSVTTNAHFVSEPSGSGILVVGMISMMLASGRLLRRT